MLPSESPSISNIRASAICELTSYQRWESWKQSKGILGCAPKGNAAGVFLTSFGLLSSLLLSAIRWKRFSTIPFISPRLTLLSPSRSKILRNKRIDQCTKSKSVFSQSGESESVFNQFKKVKVSLVSSKPEDLLQLLLIASPADDCSNDKELLKTFSGFALREKLAPLLVNTCCKQIDHWLKHDMKFWGL